MIPETNSSGDKLLFVLSPNDLVYVPTHGETEVEDKRRIFKFISSSNMNFVPVSVAKPIVDCNNAKLREFDSHNSITTLNGISIKDVCLPIEIDRLGNVTLKKIGEDD